MIKEPCTARGFSRFNKSIILRHPPLQYSAVYSAVSGVCSKGDLQRQAQWGMQDLIEHTHSYASYGFNEAFLYVLRREVNSNRVNRTSLIR